MALLPAWISSWRKVVRAQSEMHLTANIYHPESPDEVQRFVQGAQMCSRAGDRTVFSHLPILTNCPKLGGGTGTVLLDWLCLIPAVLALGRAAGKDLANPTCNNKAPALSVTSHGSGRCSTEVQNHSLELPGGKYLQAQLRIFTKDQHSTLDVCTDTADVTGKSLESAIHRQILLFALFLSFEEWPKV